MIAILFGISTCSYLNISGKDEYQIRDSRIEKARNNSCVIMGSIHGEFPHSLTKMVLAAPIDKPGSAPGNHVILVDNQNYMLYLPAGEYMIGLLLDYNNDDLFEANELVGSFNQLNPIILNEGDVRTRIDIHQHLDINMDSPFPDQLKIRYNFDSHIYLAANGQVRKIYDAVFSRENARVGYWSPTNFMESFGANFYMEEPFDPTRIPVIFVHGSNGTPQDWVYFRLRLDKRFQPVYFYYPSGLRLTLVARLLHEKLIDFTEQHNIRNLCLVAHSMGGLITQEMLTSYGMDIYPDLVGLYVTLATPWSGFESADTAVATSPKKLPFWIDIASRSMFIKKLMNKPLPDKIDHYLFFGRDDQVSRGRALDERAFKNVKGAYAFDVNHSTILSDRRVFRQYQSLLEKSFPRK